MNRPYTVYPDPADNPYMIGVPCPYCGAEANQRCVTSGGNAYGELCHKKRREAAYAASIELRVVKPASVVDPGPELDIPDKIQALKIAFWYIDKMGGVERARVYFDAAAKALADTPDDPGASSA